jgi:hypothetical protein
MSTKALTSLFILAVISFADALAVQGQVSLWIAKMETVKLFKEGRADRNRIFGTPEDGDEGKADTTYYFDDGYIFVLSVDEVCSQQNKNYPGDIPENQSTVGELRLYVYDDHEIPFASLGLRVEGFRSQELLDERTGLKYKLFESESEGRLYKVNSDGFVDSIVLFVNREELVRSCR